MSKAVVTTIKSVCVIFGNWFVTDVALVESESHSFDAIASDTHDTLNNDTLKKKLSVQGTRANTRTIYTYRMLLQDFLNLVEPLSLALQR